MRNVVNFTLHQILLVTETRIRWAVHVAREGGKKRTILQLESAVK
jgi:hypothetical protein